MKLKINALFAAALASSLLLNGFAAETEPGHNPAGAEKTVAVATHIQIKNKQGETLGRIRDFSVDLTNARIVEVLVVSGDTLGMGGRTVSVPPSAFTVDAAHAVYTLDVSAADFAAAPEIDLSKWEEAGQGTRIAEAYRLFNQEPYFLGAGENAATSKNKARVAMGYVARASKLNGMPVTNLQGQVFGAVFNTNVMVSTGKVTQVIVIAPGLLKTSSVIPPTAFTFNPARDGLLLDMTEAQFAEQPRYKQVDAGFDNKARAVQEIPTAAAISAIVPEQGASVRDEDITAMIKQKFAAAKIDESKINFGVLDGKVTLRGSVATQDEKNVIGKIAASASSKARVDNQIIVGL